MNQRGRPGEHPVIASAYRARSSAAQVPLSASSRQSSLNWRKSSSRRVRSRLAQRLDAPGARQHHVAVVDVAEHALQSLAASRAAFASGAEAGAGDLQHVAQPLGGDPHVVLGRRRRGLERARGEGAQLVEPGADDPRRVGTQRRRRVEALAPRAPSSLRRLRRACAGGAAASSAARARRRAPARRSPAAARRAAARSAPPAAARSPSGASSANRSRNSIATSRSRRSPSASASALTRFSARRCRLRRKARLEDLERGAQAPGRHPHVVHPLDLVDVEHAVGVLEDLGRPHLDHARRRTRERLLAVESGDLARTRHALRLDASGRGGTSCTFLRRRSRTATLSSEKVKWTPTGRRSSAAGEEPLALPLSRSRMTPSRSPPLPICSGCPSSSESFSSSSTPVARMRTRSGSSSKRRATSAAGSPHSTRIPRSSVSYSSTAPTRRRSEVALPPTATACAGCSISTPAKMSSMRSRTLRISAAEGGSEAISSSASTPEPTRQERTSRTPPGDGAEDHLGRAAADVDDADPPLDRMAERLGRADEGEPPLLLLAEDVDRHAGLLADRCATAFAVGRLAHRRRRDRSGSSPRRARGPAAPAWRPRPRPRRPSPAESPRRRRPPC